VREAEERVREILGEFDGRDGVLGIEGSCGSSTVAQRQSAEG